MEKQMEKIRTSITKQNLEYINEYNMSITKLINNLITKMRIKDALKGEQNELQENIQELIRKSKK